MKRLLAMILALAVIFCLAACSSSNQPETTGKPDSDDPQNPLDVLSNVSMGMSIADVDALISLLGRGDPGLDIENAYFEIGTSDTGALVSLGAKLLDEQHDAKLFLGDAIVLSAPSLLDQNYGLTVNELMAMLGNSAVLPKWITAASAGLNPEVLVNMLSKYYNMLVSELKKSGDVEVTSEGGLSVINGTLSSDTIAVIYVELIEELCKDDDFFALMALIEGTTADEFKESFLSDKPDKDTLLTQAKHQFGQFQISVKIKNLKLTAENIPVAGDLCVSLNQDTQGGNRPADISLVFDTEKGTLNVSCKDEGTERIGLDIGNGKLDARIDIDDTNAHLTIEVTDTAVKGSLEMNGEKVGELEMTVSETELNVKLIANGSEIILNIKTTDSAVTGTLTVDGEEMGKVAFDKKVEGSKTTLTLKTLEISNASFDFSEVGLCFYIDTNASIPAAPTYTDVSKMSEDELQAVLEKFVTDNEDLVTWISGLFQSETETGPSMVPHP